MGTLVFEEAKAQLRVLAHQQRAALGRSERTEAAKAAAAHFFKTIAVEPGQVISAYWPIRDEIDCKPILAKLMDGGHTVCLPVVVSDDAPLEFRQWEDGAALYEAGFGTLGPADGAPVVEPDILIIPLLGFDTTGTRLGYGKGHYDRSIAAMSKVPILVGYAFAAQELKDIPRAAHDVPLDWLVTEAGAQKFER